MRPYRILAVLLAIASLCSSSVLAQTNLSPEQSLRSEIRSLPAGAQVTLTPGAYGQPLEVFEGSVTVAANGAVFQDPDANSVIYVEADAELNLTGVEVIGSNPAQAMIVVNGGKLVLRDTKISGAYRFAIYATAGSVLDIGGLDAQGGELGIYLLDDVDATIEGVTLTGFGGAGLTGIGAQVRVTASSVTVEGIQGSGVVFRGGGNLVLRDATVAKATENGIYLDQGASLHAEAIILDQLGTGVLALGAGDVAVSESEMHGVTNGGIIAQGAASLQVSWVQMTGRGNLIGASKGIADVTIKEAFIESEDTEVAAVYIGHEGATTIDGISVLGGSSALFINGPRPAPTLITNADFASQGFAAVTLKGIGNTAPENAPVITKSHLLGEAGAVGLAFDTTDFAVISDSHIVGREQPALSFYESAAAHFANNILITGNDQLSLGSISSNLLTASAANVSRTGVPANALSDSYAELAEARTAKQTAAANLGQLIAVNNEGLPLWADAAILQVLSQDDQLYELPIDGTPLELPSGTYNFALDGIVQAQIELAAGDRKEIEIPDPVHPHFMFLKDGTFYRGKALMLRSPEEIAANARARNVNHMKNEYYNHAQFALPKADLTADQKTQLLEEARALFTLHLATAVEVGTSTVPVEGGRISRQVFFYTLGIIAHLGDASDRDFILANLGQERSFITDFALSAAALIEARLGQIEDSAIYAMAMDPVTPKQLAFQMLSYPALNGHAPAIEELLKRLLAAQEAGSFDDIAPGARPFMLLNQLEGDPRILDLYRALWAEYADEIDAVVNAGKKRVYFTKIGLNYFNMPLIIEYLAAFGTEEDYQSLNLPVAGHFGMEPSLSTLLTNPTAIYFDYIGQAARPAPLSYDAYTLTSVGAYICNALERRNPDDRAFVLDQMYALTGRYINEQFGNGRRDVDWVFGERYVNIPSAYCNPNTAPGSALSSDPDGLRIYFPDLYSPNWGERAVLGRQLITDFDPNGYEVKVPYLAGITPDDLQAAMMADAKFDNDAGKALLLNARTLEHRYRDFTPDVYTNGSDSRFFVTMLDASNGDAIVIGRADLRPILSDGLLRAGLRLRMAYSENGFLTAQMSGRDVEMKDALENAAFGMIKEVRLKEGDTVRPLSFTQSTSSGVHVFDLPEVSDDLTGKMIEVELYVFKETWVLQFPLYYGDFAFRQRSRL